VVRNIKGKLRNGMLGGRGIMHKELHDACLSPLIIRMMTSRLGLARLIVCMRKHECIRVLLGEPEKHILLVRLVYVDGRILLKLILE
jgi:hypothetical protein